MRERVTAWQCIGCGRTEGAQPCVGICQERRTDFVNAPDHKALLAQLAMERARDLLELLELQNDRKVIGEYSKGMRKRVAMAASLIHHPDLFLMDEPFEGVDAVGARLMKEILTDQVRRGATIFLTSHVLEVVERLCDRIAIINHGAIIAAGTLDELRSGGESLEDVFVRVLGAGRQLERLDWL